tara:strand:- start:6201 stop:6779 length:579 start_codon:yes stop_codon:yes gene_type:complete
MYNYRLKIRTFGGDPYATGNKNTTDTFQYTKYEYMINSNTTRTGNCTGCKVTRNTFGPHHNLVKRAIEKQIQKTVRVSTSEYLMNKSSLNVAEQRKGITNGLNNQSSDRLNRAVAKAVVPSRGNSSSGSVTRLRPGSLRPGGQGVDVKHNSYDRYLARLKGRKVLRQNAEPTGVNYGDVNTIKFNIVTSCKC